jgi:DNA-directed RNA polymerase specialized sigma subunit
MDPKALEERRRIAINLLMNDETTQEEITKTVGVTQSAMSRWWTRCRKGEEEPTA